MNLNDTLALAEDKEIEMLIIASIITLKRGRSGKMVKWGRIKVFDLVQSFLDSDITHKTFDELLQNIIEVNAVKWRTIGESECLSLPKEEPKYLDMVTKQEHKRFSHFSITAWKSHISLKEQSGSFKQ